MHRLGAELAAWVDLIAGLSADPSPDFPHEPVLRLLEASFDAPASYAYTRIPNAWKAPAFRYSDSTPPLPPDDDFIANWFTRPNHPHPLVRWFAVSRDPTAISVARVPPAAVPSRLVDELRSELRPLGLEQQLSVPCSVAGPARAVILAQSGHDFTDAQVELARRIQPLLMMLTRRVDAAAQQVADAAGHTLSAREAAVLLASVHGGTAATISNDLRISPRTVEKHLAAVYRKLGVHDRVSAIRQAERLGLIDAPAVLV